MFCVMFFPFSDLSFLKASSRRIKAGFEGMDARPEKNLNQRMGISKIQTRLVYYKDSVS